MTEPTTGEKSAEKNKHPLSLADAVHVVCATIKAERTKLNQIAHEDEADPVMLEGETTSGYFMRGMVDPKEVAKIMLEYDYPIYKVLEEDAPQGMWNDLARLVGLAHVCGVDL